MLCSWYNNIVLVEWALLCPCCRSVYLCIKQAVPSHILRLHLRGYEISEFDYQYVQQQGEDTFMPKVGQRKAKKDVVRADMKLVEYPGVCLSLHA